VNIHFSSQLIISVGFDTLLTRDITKSSAMQRTGRAGREVCPKPCLSCCL
jgi:hypothetical protein